MEFRRSKFVGLRTKVHLLNEGYEWVPKTRDITGIQERSSGNQRFRVYEVSTGLPRVSSTLQEVGILPTLVYFPL